MKKRKKEKRKKRPETFERLRTRAFIGAEGSERCCFFFFFFFFGEIVSI